MEIQMKQVLDDINRDYQENINNKEKLRQIDVKRIQLLSEIKHNLSNFAKMCENATKELTILGEKINASKCENCISITPLANPISTNDNIPTSNNTRMSPNKNNQNITSNGSLCSLPHQRRYLSPSKLNNNSE